MPRQKAPEILFEDDALLVLNKPAGLLSIPARDVDQHSALRQIEHGGNPVFVVHRLDRDTSGVLVFAKTAEAHRVLSIQFSERAIEKTYLALVSGRAQQEEFTVKARLIVDANGMAAVSSSGKAAETHFKVLEMFPKATLLRAMPVTGRQHQIRVHLAHVGLPLIVDPLYGSNFPFTIADIKPGVRIKARAEYTSALLLRTPLHALSLTLEHPISHLRVSFEAGLPKDIRATLQQLRRWSR